MPSALCADLASGELCPIEVHAVGDALITDLLPISGHRLVVHDDGGQVVISEDGRRTQIGWWDAGDNAWAGVAGRGAITGGFAGQLDEHTIVEIDAWGVVRIDVDTGVHTLLLATSDAQPSLQFNGTSSGLNPLRSAGPALVVEDGGYYFRSGWAGVHLDQATLSVADFAGVSDVSAENVEDVAPIGGTPLHQPYYMAHSGNRFWFASDDTIQLADLDSGLLTRYASFPDPDRNGDCAAAWQLGIDTSWCHSGDGGPAVDATILIAGMTACPDGSLYVSDMGGCIRRVSPQGVIDTVAFQCGDDGDGSGDIVEGQALGQAVGYRNFELACAPEGDVLYFVYGDRAIWALGLPAPGLVTGR